MKGSRAAGFQGVCRDLLRHRKHKGVVWFSHKQAGTNPRKQASKHNTRHSQPSLISPSIVVCERIIEGPDLNLRGTRAPQRSIIIRPVKERLVSTKVGRENPV